MIRYTDPRDPMSILATLLEHHGISSTARDGWLVTAPGQPAWRAEVTRPPGAHDSLRQLDVNLALPDGRLLTESCGASGKTPELATEELFDKFATNALHVLLSAFHGQREPSQVELEPWSFDGDAWQVHVGPLTAVRSTQTPLAPFPELLDTARDCFAESAPACRIHWLRVYRGKVEGSPANLEVLLDSAPWEAAIPRFERLAWPEEPGFTSRRMFVAMTPPPGVGPAPFLPEAESVAIGLDRLLAFVAQHPNDSDSSCFQALTAANVEPQVAERLIAFVPIAFAELLLTGARHAVEYQILSGGQAGPPRRLADEPTYAAAKRIAAELQAGSGAGASSFRALALRSATLRAANKALKAGSRLEDLAFTPPLVVLGRFSFLSVPRPAERKPWWRLW